LISSNPFCELRQLCGLLGHTDVRHVSVPSLQIAANAQGAVPAVHDPALQVSAPLQNNPSEHDVPSGWFTSAGQLSELPVHISAASHELDAARQTVLAGAFASAGHG
jgi:hypothetical protein